MIYKKLEIYKLLFFRKAKIVMLFTCISFWMALSSFAQLNSVQLEAGIQNHPHTYIANTEKKAFQERIESSEMVSAYINKLKAQIEPEVSRHLTDP